MLVNIRSRRFEISIHSLRMEGDSLPNYLIDTMLISIHSLRMEGDLIPSTYDIKTSTISIHSLRMEGDLVFFVFVL